MIKKHTHKEWQNYVFSAQPSDIVRTLETIEDTIVKMEKTLAVKEQIAIDEMADRLRDSGASTRVIYAMAREHVVSMKDLAGRVEDESIFKIRNIGKKSLLEIADILEKCGYSDSAEKIRGQK